MCRFDFDNFLSYFSKNILRQHRTNLQNGAQNASEYGVRTTHRKRIVLRTETSDTSRPAAVCSSGPHIVSRRYLDVDLSCQLADHYNPHF
jgi:hypothetical protein